MRFHGADKNKSFSGLSHWKKFHQKFGRKARTVNKQVEYWLHIRPHQDRKSNNDNLLTVLLCTHCCITCKQWWALFHSATVLVFVFDFFSLLHQKWNSFCSPETGPCQKPNPGQSWIDARPTEPHDPGRAYGPRGPLGHLGWQNTRWPRPPRSSHELQNDIKRDTERACLQREKRNSKRWWKAENKYLLYSVFSVFCRFQVSTTQIINM